MQKALNVLFILILVAIATIAPLDSSLLHFKIFNPIVDEADHTPAEMEQIRFVGIEGLKLALPANRETILEDDSELHWIRSEKAPLLTVSSADSEMHSLVFTYHSNTEAFQEEFPPISIVRAKDVFPIRPTPEVLSREGKYARFEFDLSTVLGQIPPGYHYAEIRIGEEPVGQILFSKDTKISKKLLPYRFDIPKKQKAVTFFFPDEDYRALIPVSRYYPEDFKDYIVLYNTLIQGGAEGFGLKTAPSGAITHDYWIADGSSKINYLSRNLEPFEHRDLVFRSVGYTFAALGDLKKTNINVNGKPEQSFETPTRPYCYLPYENNSDHLYIIYEQIAAADLSALISGFVDRMHSIQLLSPAVRLINCELGDGGVLSVDFSDYGYNENPEVFEALLNLTAYSAEQVKELKINGISAPKIKAYNLEQKE